MTPGAILGATSGGIDPAAAYLVGGVRTPVGRYGGALSGVRPDDLAALVLGEALARSGLDPEHLDEVILGTANQAGEDNRNVARMAVLLAGLPERIPAITVNRLCASGLSAVILAAQMIRAGDAWAVLAGGVESMSRAPWVQEKPPRAFARPGEIADSAIGWRFTNPKLAARGKTTFSMPETAEEVARVRGITRTDADAYALESQRRAGRALDAGVFAAETVPVPTAHGVVAVDEAPRPGTTPEALAALPAIVPGGGVVTAGNSSPLNDGASALLVASGAAVLRHGLQPRARVLAQASVGVAPETMGLGPIPATRLALERAGLTVADLGTVELNEAFATQSLACLRELGLDPGRVNALGGAIALGHPLGSSGSRIVVTLLGRLERERQRYGLATMCVGVGQGTALILERVGG